LQFARCDVTDRRQVEQVIQGSDAVVNLVGSFQGNLKQLMGISAGWMAEAAAATGAEAFVQVSAIALRPDEDVEIDYAEAKHLGEDLVREAFPNATILRPSLLFGKDDDFTTMFAQMIRWLPVLPVFGPDKELQLVYVDDVAEAVAVALESPGEHGGKIFELGGPEKVTMLELNRRIAEAQRRSRTFLPMPDGVAGAFASLPGTPMGSDQWELLKQGNTVSGEHPGLAELGIEPKPLGLFLDKWMVRYRKHGRFGDRAMASGGL
jgi:NADH dehydrogenase